MPTISVIIPTYNRADLLKETLESVLAQTYTDYEIIVIDDGSTDNTEEVVSALQANNPQIRYIKQDNAGEGAARNHGIFESRGEWLAFLDSDDLWFPDKLEKQIKFLAEHPTADAVCCPAYSYSEGQVIKDEKGKPVCPWGERETSILPFELFASHNHVNSSSVLVRKTVLYKAGLFECGLKAGVDYILWVRVAKFAEFWILNEVVGYYRQHPTNVSKDINYHANGALARKMQIARWSNEPHVVKLYEEWLSGFYNYLGDDCRQDKNFKEASRHYWSASYYAHNSTSKIYLFAKYILAKFLPFIYRMRDK